MNKYLIYISVIFIGMIFIIIGIIRLVNAGILGANAGKNLHPQIIGFVTLLLGAIFIKRGCDLIYHIYNHKKQEKSDNDKEE
jgi:hypothetical protein